MCVSMAPFLSPTSENSKTISIQNDENPKEETTAYARKSQSMLYGGVGGVEKRFLIDMIHSS